MVILAELSINHPVPRRSTARENVGERDPKSNRACRGVCISENKALDLRPRGFEKHLLNIIRDALDEELCLMN